MRTSATDPHADRLAMAARALDHDPELAVREAREVLSRDQTDPRARLVLGAALRRSGDLVAARTVLEPLARTQSNSAPAQIEAGLVLEACGDDAAAVPFLRRAAALRPSAQEAWRALARLFERSGEPEAALDALRSCLRHAPASFGAAYDLAVLLHRSQEDEQALMIVEGLAAARPEDDLVAGLLAACSTRVGDYDRAATLYRALLRRDPGNPAIWLSLGHAARALGDRTGAVEAYRECLALAPGRGEAHWSLATLTTARHSEGAQADLRARLRDGHSTPDDRAYLHYALGRLLERDEHFEDSFAHYAAGAAICREQRLYDAGAALAELAPARHDFPSGVLDRLRNAGATPGPIFIVGLPRSGSTLIEQILASHSAVEGCGELPIMMNIARCIAVPRPEPYPVSVANLTDVQIAALGDGYLRQSLVYRREGRARFVDKMPNNLHHLALIRLALPGARIIDARRSPMAAGFAVFKQHFAAGHAFSYDLEDIGRYYRAYAALMTHYDSLMPGAVLRVDYERLVLDTEAEVRRLLDFCGLPFEPACLAFHANNRAVRTASSEQVRRPIYREALEHWKNYEPWLEPLARSVGFTA